MSKRLNLMLDIETLGKEHYGLIPITSISLVPFTRNGIIADYNRFNMKIDVMDYDKLKLEGFDVYSQIDTIKWWMSQPKEVSEDVFNGGSPLREVMNSLKLYMEDIMRKYDVTLDETFIYCKSPDFDVRIIHEWEQKLSHSNTSLFKYNRTRCVRTDYHR